MARTCPDMIRSKSIDITPKVELDTTMDSHLNTMNITNNSMDNNSNLMGIGKRPQLSVTTPNEVQGPLTKKPCLNSIIFTSSEKDRDSVDIICKNLEEFGKLAAENGFELVARYETGNRMTIRLMQSNMQFDSRKAFQDLDNLIKIKKSKNEETTAKFDEAASFMQEKLNHFSTIQEIFYKDMKNKMDNNANLVEHFKSEMKKSIEMCKSKNKFDFQPLHMILNDCPALLEHICDLLTEKDPPSYMIPFPRTMKLEQKKKEFINYTHLLQLPIEKKCSFTPIQQNISHWLTNPFRFLYNPSMAEMQQAASVMKDKYDLDNVIGTVHFLVYRDKKTGPAAVLAIAIMNKKIVSCTRMPHATKEMALMQLNGTMECQPHYSKDVRFAVPIVISEHQNYVYCGNTNVYVENERVIRWIKDNFLCLLYPIYGGHALALPSIYNMLARY